MIVRRFNRELASAALLVALATPAGAQNPADSQPPPNLDQMQEAFQQIVRQVSPSVVGIRVKRRQAALPLPPGAAGGRTDALIIVNGSGAVIRREGLILTNEHVVQSASQIEVVLNDGRALEATVHASDPRGDLAILKIARDDLVPVRLCDWSAIARGQWTLALGNPFGLGGDGKPSVSVGVIANLGRRLPGLGEVDDRLYDDMIQTTAVINPGNSGGPLFNIRGEMIGIVTAMHTRNAADDGVGFAIPLTPARREQIEKLVAGQRVEYGYLGLTARTPEQTERAAAGVNEPIGALVVEVEADGPAAEAGIKPGDLLLRFDSRTVDSTQSLVEWVGLTPIGKRVAVNYFREGRHGALDVTIQRRQVNRVSWLRSGAFLWRGLRVTDLTPEARERLLVDGDAVGVVILEVENDSPIARQIQIGDVIERVEQARVRDVHGFRQAVQSQNGPVEVTVRGRGKVRVSP